MMTINTTLIPPSFVDGLSPVDLIAWGKQADGTERINKMLGLYGQDTTVDLLLMRYSRERLVALLTEEIPPETPEQAEFLTAVKAGQPVSLLSVGNEELSEQGFQPELRRIDAGWQWRCGAYEGQSADLREALDGYVNAVNLITG